MERTWLKIRDKNGKKLYEGDYIKFKGIKFELNLCSGMTKLIEVASMFSMKHGDFWLYNLFIDKYPNLSCSCMSGGIKIKEFTKVK